MALGGAGEGFGGAGGQGGRGGLGGRGGGDLPSKKKPKTPTQKFGAPLHV